MKDYFGNFLSSCGPLRLDVIETNISCRVLCSKMEMSAKDVDRTVGTIMKDRIKQM
jgi:hypothetical protein